jgi:lysophospholipase L1-like esterase
MEHIRELLSGKKPVNYLFYGDSITHGASHTAGFRDYTEHFRERIRWEMRRIDDLVLNAAASGYTTRDLLWGFERVNSCFHPDLAFVMIGTNDCVKPDISISKFEDNINLLSEKFAAIGTVLVLQTACPAIPKHGYPHDEKIPLFMEIIRKTANERNILLVDHYQFWAKEPVRFIYWMADAIHPNAYGHIAMAQYLFKALGIWDDNAPTCKFYIP